MAATETLHTIQLPRFGKSEHKVLLGEVSDPQKIAQAWLDAFEVALQAGDATSLSRIIHPEGWWRDHIALSWDFHTLKGITQITDFVCPRLGGLKFQNLKLKDRGHFTPQWQTPMDGLTWVESMFSFETAIGSGKGVLRLVRLPNASWKALMIYTSLQSLKGSEEAIGDARPYGGDNSVRGGKIEGSWFERRQKTTGFSESQPKVILIGAGQAGLNLAARLQALGVSCLVVDKNERIGDNWRNRYRTLVTHDPVQYTHMAYMPFPKNWPLFTPKDKLADWLELYASAMELNVWMNTTIQFVDFSCVTQTWTVELDRGDGKPRTLKAKHVVLCTGQAGEAYMPNFPGQKSFKGTVYHGGQHKDASTGSDVAGKKVVVVGTGNSGHDIAQNFAEHGASVSMLQRHGTYVLSAKKGLFMLHEGLYDEHGPPTEEADIYAQSLPIPVQFALNVGLTDRIKEAEKDTLDKLGNAGFKLDFGHDGSGIYRKYITRGGGYYIDVGASQLIIEGKIKVVQSEEGIKGFDEHHLILADDRKLDADIVVLATGYDNMRTTLRKILGDKIANSCKDAWDLDEEGEVNAMWRPLGHPNLWCMGGSLALCRTYSKYLALQIKAQLTGIRRT